MGRWGIDDEVSEGDDVTEGVPGGEGREEEAVNDGVEIGDGWSSSDGGSVWSDIRGTKWNFFCRRLGTVAGDCGLIGDWVIPPALPPVDASFTGMRGRKANLGGKFELLGFEGAGECGSRKKGVCLDANGPPLDEVFFDPPMGGGVDGAVDGSDNKGSKPTGTRFKS